MRFKCLKIHLLSTSRDMPPVFPFYVAKYGHGVPGTYGNDIRTYLRRSQTVYKYPRSGKGK